MEQYETNVATIMTFLKANNYSASVISQHKLCYQDLKQYLLAENLDYSFETACHWIETHKNDWHYRKYTGYRHCINQLEDVFQHNEISLDHLAFRKPAYKSLTGYYRSIVDDFIENATNGDDRYRIACSRFLLYLQNNNVENISSLNYDWIMNFHKDDYHTSSTSKDVYEDLIRCFLRHLSEKGLCNIGLSLALNKLLIKKIVKLPIDDISNFTKNTVTYDPISWDDILTFLSKMEKKDMERLLLIVQNTF